MKYLAIMMMLGTLGLTGCDEGPAEKMGRDIDNAATDVGNAVEDVCEDVTGDNC